MNQLQDVNWKIHKLWRLNNMLLNNQWVKEEINAEILKKYHETNDNGNTIY